MLKKKTLVGGMGAVDIEPTQFEKMSSTKVELHNIRCKVQRALQDIHTRMSVMQDMKRAIKVRQEEVHRQKVVDIDIVQYNKEKAHLSRLLAEQRLLDNIKTRGIRRHLTTKQHSSIQQNHRDQAMINSRV